MALPSSSDPSDYLKLRKAQFLLSMHAYRIVLDIDLRKVGEFWEQVYIGDWEDLIVRDI